MAHCSAQDLDSVHREAFTQAISRVLATEIAEFTYAQILDGLPTAEVFRDRYSGPLHVDHPLRKHTQLCAGVLDRLKDRQKNFDPSSIRFNPNLVEAFQKSSMNSRDFQMRLIEMVAVAVHQIAVMLFQLDESLHKDDGTTSWKPEVHGNSLLSNYFRNMTPPDTLFFHPAYKRKGEYPDGVADMVGYWAENRILGGVVLFDRGQSGFEVLSSSSNLVSSTSSLLTPLISQCKDVYFHSDRDMVTYRIYKLLDSQVDALVQFLTVAGTSCPLPILGDKQNRDRVDPDDAIDVHGIFRDRWERAVPVRDEDYWRRRRDVENDLDYPEHADMMEELNRMFPRRN